VAVFFAGTMARRDRLQHSARTRDAPVPDCRLDQRRHIFSLISVKPD